MVESEPENMNLHLKITNFRVTPPDLTATAEGSNRVLHPPPALPFRPCAGASAPVLVHVLVPRLWNTLTIQLRHCDSLGQFKRLLKTYLFGGWDRGAL